MSSGDHEPPQWRNPIVHGDGRNLADKPRPPPPCSPRPPSPKRVNIPGTANIVSGYRIHSWRNPNVKRRKTSLFARIPPDYEDPGLAADRIFAVNIKKEQLLDRRIIRQKINRKAEEAMRQWEEDLERQRAEERKRQLKEEVEMTRKLVEKARREEEQRVKELEARRFEAEEQREKERQEFIHQKMLQRYLISNQELREERWRARTVDRKKVNLLQIEYNRKRQELEQQEELDWLKLMKEHSMKGVEEERLKEEKRVETLRMQAQTHLKQRDEKINREAKMRTESWGPTSLDIGEIRDPVARKKAQIDQFCSDLNQQVAETKKIIEERRRQEEELDKLSMSLELSRDKTPEEEARDRVIRFKEYETYMEGMKEVRDAIAKRQAEVDNCVRELAARRDSEKQEARRQARQNEKRLNRELSHFWDQQREQKRQREESLKEPPFNNEDWEDPVKLDREEKLESWQRAKCYGRELMQQHEATTARRTRMEREQDEAAAKELEEIERQTRELADELARTCLRHHIPNMIP